MAGNHRNGNGLAPTNQTIWERWGNKPVEFIRDCIRDPKSFKYARDPKTSQLLRDGKGRLIKVYQPFKLFPEQQRFIREAFTLTEDGHFPYADMLYSLPKKNGKSSTAAMLALFTAIVIGDRQPYAGVYVLANDLEQSTSVVFELIKRMIEVNPGLKARAKIGSTRIDFPDTGAFIVAVAHDFAGLAGIEPTLTILDELWAFKSENSQRLYEQAIPVPTIPVSGRLVVTFAGISGESALLERLYQRGIQGEEIAPSLYRQRGLLMFWTHEFINQSKESLQWKEEQRLSARRNTYLREVCNEWTSAESAFVAVEEWDACTDSSLRPVLQDPDLEVYAGLDCSVRSDFTALAVVAFDEAANKIRIVDHRLFKPTGGQDIDYAQVEQAIVDLNRRFDLRMVSFDPHQAEYLSQRLRAAGIPMDHFHQTPDRQTQAAANLVNLISQRNIVSYPSPELRDAVANSRIVESTKGFRLAKLTGSRKIDLIVALSFAVVVALREGRGEPGMLTYYRVLSEGGSFDDGGESLYEEYERGMREFEEAQRPKTDWQSVIRSVGDDSYTPPGFRRKT